MDQKAAAIQVTGDGHGHREFRNRPFGHRELAPGFRRLKAEGLTSERLTTVAVTRHLGLIMPETLIPVSGFPLSASLLQPATWGCHPPPEIVNTGLLFLSLGRSASVDLMHRLFSLVPNKWVRVPVLEIHYTP